MTDQKPLTEQQLTDIETRANATPDGPWALSDDLDGDGYPGHLWVVRTPASGPDEPDEHSAVVSIGNRALGEFIAAARTDVDAMAAEIRRLRAERDELRGKFADAAASLAEQVLRYGQRQREHNADREELERLRTALTEIRHLHKDSPMGPCPVCIDADAAAAGGDGLVPYPCPTGRLAGAQDCDPPHMRAAAAGEQPGVAASEASGTDADDLQARADECAEGDCPHAYQARSNESEASRYRHELETLADYLEDRDGIDPAVATTLRGILARALDR